MMFFAKWAVFLVTIILTRADEWTDLLPNTTICGTGSDFDQFPWMALIEYEEHNGNHTFACGGFLINKRYVLTAAVCTKERKNSKILGVRLGEYNLNTDPDCIKTVRGVQCAPSPVNIQIEELIAHEDFLSGDPNHSHDIALLRLKEEVEFTETVKPICLPLSVEIRSKTYLGHKLTVAGWGRTESARFSSMKRKVKLPVVEQEACKSLYNKHGVNLDNGQFCAGGELGRDSCQGDTGNPIIGANIDESAKVRWYAVGIVSFGPSTCGLKNWPGVYTNVSAHMPWIFNKLKP